MKTAIVGSVPLPNGTYKGTWGGYRVKLCETPYPVPIELQTAIGVRTMAMPVVVVVQDGRGHVEPDQSEPTKKSFSFEHILEQADIQN